MTYRVVAISHVTKRMYVREFPTRELAWVAVGQAKAKVQPSIIRVYRGEELVWSQVYPATTAKRLSQEQLQARRIKLAVRWAHATGRAPGDHPKYGVYFAQEVQA